MYTDIVKDFKRHCEGNYPLEACGLITKSFEYVKGTNISPNPKNEFILDHKLLMDYDENIWALCHTHPGDSIPTPSMGDYPVPVFKDYKFIVGNTEKVFIYWYDENIKNLVIEPFEERHCKLK